jgi:hypothetical protein
MANFLLLEKEIRQAKWIPQTNVNRFDVGSDDRAAHR